MAQGHITLVRNWSEVFTPSILFASGESRTDLPEPPERSYFSTILQPSSSAYVRALFTVVPTKEFVRELVREVPPDVGRDLRKTRSDIEALGKAVLDLKAEKEGKAAMEERAKDQPLLLRYEDFRLTL